MEFLIALITISLVSAIIWYSGTGSTVIELAFNFVGKGLSWIFHPQLAVGNIVERLSFRGFWQSDEVIETKTHIFTAFELIPVVTDGFDNGEWNHLHSQLNTLLTNLPVGTVFQTDAFVDDHDLGAAGVLERIKSQQSDPNLELISDARIFHLKELKKNGLLKNTRVFCFLGRPIKVVKFKFSFRDLLSPRHFLSHEYLSFKSTLDETLRLRNQFFKTYESISGNPYAVRKVLPQEVFGLIFEKLNPVIKEKLEPRNYPKNLIPRRAAEYYQAQEPDAAALLRKISPSEFFADSPRETLSLSDFEFLSPEYFKIDGRYFTVLSLNTLPSASELGMIERLTRVSSFGYPVNFTTSVTIEDQTKWEKHFTTIYRYLDEDLKTGTDTATQLQKKLQIEDIEDFRTRLRVANDKICLFGFNLIISADTEEEILTRKNEVLNFIAEIDGFQLAYEKHLPLPQFLQLLPCENNEHDAHRKPFLVRAALGLMPFTGGNRGVPTEEATSVFTRADNGTFAWNPQSKQFASGMAGVIGKAGAGKSVFLNRLRTDAANEQRKIVSVDFDVSSEGLVHLFGGKIINFRNGGVGFFDIRPKPGEDIGEDRLDENGIPKGRYEEICFLLEKLCLPPNSAMTDDLTPAESSFLKEKIYQTYQNVRNRIPIMDDFLLSFENCRVSERPISQNLIDRLRKFAGAGFLGELLNREEEALQPDNSYTVFDFRFVQDNPQLALVATLMVKMFMRRFLAQEKNIKKYFDVDEVRVIAENPLLAALFSLIYSTARKRNCYCVAATQSPRHFLAENLRDLRDNMEVFWVLPVNDPELAQKAFKLSHGQRKLVEYISREGIGLNHRDLALFYPQGAAHLRFRLNPLDNRLLAQRGRQLLSEEETLDFIARVQQVETPSLTPAMVKALKLD